MAGWAGTTGWLNLQRARLLVSDIGLPNAVGEGVRLGTPEVTRLGFEPDAMATIGSLIARALDAETDPAGVAREVTDLRQQHDGLRFTPSAG